MNPTHNPIDRWQVIIAASLLSGAGALMFGAFPVFLAAAAKQLSLSEEQVGYLPSAFYVGYTCTAISTVFWVRRVNWQLAAAFGVAITALPLFAMQGIGSYPLMLGLMVVGGAGMGILYSLATAILSDSSNPDRVFGLKLAVETMPGTALLFLLPILVIPDWGFNGTALVMALCAAISALCILWLPKAGQRSTVEINGSEAEPNQGGSSLLVWLGLAATTLYFMGVVSPWVFLQLIGESLNLPGEKIGIVLSAGLFIAILGGFIAAAIGTRFGHIPPMTVIMGIFFVALFILERSQGLLGFAVGSLMLLSTLNLALSFLLGLTARVDKQGKLIVLSTAAIAGAVIIGPGIAGNLVDSGDFTSLLWFSAACGALSLALYVYISLRAHVDEQQHLSEGTLAVEFIES